jgi:cellulose synthase/poly-beta-1,6-N-acetylglucosamine synthase-like glycosyltransferase
MRSFLFSRSGWNSFGGAISLSGALSLFDYESVVAIGGFDAQNTSQDFEVVTHLHEYKRSHHEPYTVAYTAAAVAWTQVPQTLLSYWKQRYHWQRDSLRSMMLHKHMFFNPRYGITGMFTYPFYLLGDLFGAVVELTAYLMLFLSWYIGILDTLWAVLFFIIAFGFITFLTMATALMSFATYNKYGRLSNLLWILLIVSIESFGFRQYSVICRVTATVSYFLNSLKFWK